MQGTVYSAPLLEVAVTADEMKGVNIIHVEGATAYSTCLLHCLRSSVSSVRPEALILAAHYSRAVSNQ
jgi:hypothetical protein